MHAKQILEEKNAWVGVCDVFFVTQLSETVVKAWNRVGIHLSPYSSEYGCTPFPPIFRSKTIRLSNRNPE